MPSKPDLIEHRLHNHHILIVEDDIHLAERIAELFKEETGLKPEVAYYMDQATYILSDSDGFDLVVMDVMLPKTREDFEAIQELEKILEEARVVAEKYGSQPLTGVTNTELFDARYKRSQALRQIDDLIVREGGIALVEEWHNITATQNKFSAVLYLTAVGNPIFVQRGLSAAKEVSDWLIKPVSSDEILSRCVKLLQKVKSHGR
jgi:DNA-binding response OmpR family regulator